MNNINILPRGIKAKPTFKSREEFENWSSNFYKRIKPRLKKLDSARRNSIIATMNKIYY